MPSQLQTDTTLHDEILGLKQKALVRSSGQPQDFKLSTEKVLSPGENSTDRLNIKPTERTAPDQHARMLGKAGVGNSVQARPLGNRHKPWPRRKVIVEEEVVKYMSSVPSYLQPQEKGDNVQDKALNVGVLDWGRLEKWTYLQKQVANRRVVVDSHSCSSTSSSPFSTSGSSSHSDRSIGSPLAPMKQPPTLMSSQSSATGRHTRTMKEQNFVPVTVNLNVRTSHDKASNGHKEEKGRTGGSEVKGISCDQCSVPEIGCSSFVTKDDDAYASSHDKVNAQGCISRDSRNSQNCEKQGIQANLDLAEKELSCQFSVVETMWDHLHESFYEKHVSSDSTMESRGSVEVSRNSFSGMLPPSDIQFTSPPRRVSCSRPSSSTSQVVSPAVAGRPFFVKEALIADAKSELVKLELFTDKLSEKVVCMADKSCQAKAKVAAAPRRDLSPQLLLRAGLNRIRSSSSKEGSLGQQTKQASCSDPDDSASNRKGRRSPSPQRLLNAGLNLLRNSSSREGATGQKMKETVCSDNSYEDSTASNIRSRRSPLRRIFDPLKPKNHIPFSGPLTSLPSHRAQGASNREKISIRDELQSANGSYRSSDAVISYSTIQDTEAGCSFHGEKQVTSTRQALLKLAWKNRFPLFVFSSSDINILVATMEKRSISQTDLECIYTIFTAHETKKKSGVWTSQVNKNKKHDLVYNAVGQVKVSYFKSTSDDLKNYSLVRTFVLYGSEQLSSSRECVGSQFKNELAAIVIWSQNERPESDNACDILKNSSCRGSSHVPSTEYNHSNGSLRVKEKNENPTLASMVAILPRGVHGTSSTGEPSTLIERWKSGGSCDCGGWDEGCMLTIFTDNIQERSSSSDRPSIAGGTHQIELFAQGETKETRHAFSMITFQEGVYTVDFGVSISSLQAFAMCIATLHSRKVTTLPGLQGSVEAQTSEEQTILQGGSSTSYLPEHPPLSPVRRA